MKLKTTLAILVSPIVLSGCVATLVQDAVMGSHPTYEEVEQEWSSPSAGRGRIVLYQTRERGKQVIGNLIAMGFIVAELEVRGLDYSVLDYSVLDGCFIYDDLPTGPLAILEKRSGATLDLVLAEGEIRFLRVRPGELPEEEPWAVAEPELMGLHHNFGETLPFDDQPIVKRTRD